jgi:membrane-bound serine protease (ClpP class)
LLPAADLQLGTFGAAILLVVFLVILAAAVLYFVIWSLRKKPVTGVESMIGETGVAVSDLTDSTDGEVSVDGVIWKARISEGQGVKISKGEYVRIVRVSSLTLMVQREEPPKGG